MCTPLMVVRNGVTAQSIPEKCCAKQFLNTAPVSPRNGARHMCVGDIAMVIQQAQRHLAGMILNRPVTLAVHGEDRYKRTLAIVFSGGRDVNRAMLQAGLIDEVVIYMAPLLMGDAARGLFHLPGLERMEQRIGLEITDLRAVGQDLRITAKVERP